MCLVKILETHVSWHTSLRELILQPNLSEISRENKSSKKRENRARQMLYSHVSTSSPTSC
jgi:hypothetical protein